MSWYDKEELDRDTEKWDKDCKESADKYDREVKDNASRYDKFED